MTPAPAPDGFVRRLVALLRRRRCDCGCGAPIFEDRRHIKNFRHYIVGHEPK